VTEEFTERDLDIAQAKPRPKGSLPYLPNNGDVELLRGWLTRAFKPSQGWRFENFERAGRGKLDPCSITFSAGRESRTFRFKQQQDLVRSPRPAVLGISDGWLAMPHLTMGEVEDVWAALCTLGRVLTEHDEIQQTREWIEQLLPATLPLNGHTLVPDGRHDALMAIRAGGEFTKQDALSMIRPSDEQRWQQRPCRFIDAQTREQFLRVGETACYLRYVVGVEPLSHATLKARLHEIGVVAKLYEDYRPPHPKAQLYQLSDELIEQVSGK
jgi:hypothetical protein